MQVTEASFDEAAYARYCALVELLQAESPYQSEEQIWWQLEQDLAASGVDVFDPAEVDIAVCARLGLLRKRLH